MTMTFEMTFRGLVAATLSILFAAAATAAPMTFSQGLGFRATNQSMWGPGGSNVSFGADGSIGSSSFGVSYDTSASSGRVSATLNGTIRADYESEIADRGVHDVAVRFTGSSSNVSTELGARVDVDGYVNLDFGFLGTLDESICLYCRAFDLDTSRNYTPGFGSTVTRTGSFTAAGVGPNLIVVGGGVNVDVSQDVSFTPQSLNGLARYTHRESGLSRTAAFAISSASVLDVPLLLDRNGTWDVEFASLDVANAFGTTFGLDLNGELWYDFAIFSDSLGIALGGIDLFDSPTFALDFGPLSTSSFAMTVPEPGAFALLSIGVLGLAWQGRRAPSVRARRA